MRNGIEVEPLVTRPRKLIPRVWKKLRSRRLVDRRFPEVFEEALALQEVFTRCEVDAVFDVGANEGQFRRRVERLGFRGKVISFEPDPDCVAVLTAASKGDPNWIIEPYGLGDAEGSLILNRTKASGMNSFLQPTSGSGTGFDVSMQRSNASRTSMISRGRFSRWIPRVTTPRSSAARGPSCNGSWGFRPRCRSFRSTKTCPPWSNTLIS